MGRPRFSFRRTIWLAGSDRLKMVLQVGADARHVRHHADAVRPQQIGRPDPGKLKELRRVERTARKYHLAGRVRGVHRAATPVFDADRAASLEQDAARQRVGDDREIGPAPRLPEYDRRRPAAAVLRGELEIAGALLGRAVEIVVAGKACRCAASMKASHSGCGSQTFDTASGPPTPCSTSSPRSKLGAAK